MTDYKDKLNKKLKDSQKYIKDSDMKGLSQSKLKQFFHGIKKGKRLPIMIASFLLMLILWVPMMYGSMTLSIFTGQDGMSNKELNGLQDRLDDKYEKMFGE
ncbi:MULTISPECIES: hypothetical protein [Staphylococcus]|uniref:hypothetical protein n=1 Tax=Staphylococcus TaxID=1279 RepID=UPI0010125AEA|nr:MULTISPECIES: hypothetical protein [Staphylococcus]MBL0377893.1 hypothetical protein [Staphylococcus sp. S75]MBL0383784.1 hypothetical protein [Staphylococcus sp. S59]MBL0401743.1 hypothetical protein [Staphylococcus sp. S36]MDU9372334.1 hypothetical protein [Staphylococcus ureilyticus]RXZ28067.1 hypothetical protein ESM34_06860 [Staphylococcus sp. SNAZ 59]